MKEIVISLLEGSEAKRVNTYSLIKETLSPLAVNKVISLSTREKNVYSEEDLNHTIVSLLFKIDCAEDKFLGAFQSWFAYPMSGIKEIGPGTFEWKRKCLGVCLSQLRNVTCMIHRINSLKDKGETGYNGKIYLEIYDVVKDCDGVEFEPLPKHAKYFESFSEINPFDF